MDMERIIRESGRLREVGNDYFRSGRYPLAWKCYHKALKILDKLDEKKEDNVYTNDVIPLLIKIHSNLSAVELKLHNYVRAEYHCSHVLSKYEGHSGISSQRLKLYFRRFKCLSFLTRYEEARRDIKFCVMHRRMSNERLFMNERAKLKKFVNERNFLNSFGSRQNNDLDVMREYYVENIKKKVKFKKSTNIVRTFNRMYSGQVISEANQKIKMEFEIKFGYDEMAEGEKQLYTFKLFDVALRKFENALVSFRNNNHDQGLGTCYYNLGNVFGILHQRNKAAKYYLLALEIAKKHGDLFVVEGLSRQLASLLSKMPPPPRASHKSEEGEGEEEDQRRYCYVFKDCYTYLLNCMRVKKHIEDVVGIGRVHEAISRLFLREKRFEEAMDNLKMARKIYNALKEEEEEKLQQEDEEEQKRQKDEEDLIEDVKQGKAERQVFRELKKFRDKEKKREAEEEAREAERLGHMKLGRAEKLKFLYQRMNSVNNLEIRIRFGNGEYDVVSRTTMSEDTEEENIRDLYKIRALTALSLKSWDRAIFYTEEGIKICQQIQSSLQFHKSYLFRNKIWHNDFEWAFFFHLKAKCLISKYNLKEKYRSSTSSSSSSTTNSEEKQIVLKKSSSGHEKRRNKVRSEVRKLLDLSTSYYVKCIVGYFEWNVQEIHERFKNCIIDSFQEYVILSSSSESSTSSNKNIKEEESEGEETEEKEEKKEEVSVEFMRKRAISEIDSLMSILEEYRSLVSIKERKEKFDVFLECVSQVSYLLYPDSFTS